MSNITFVTGCYDIATLEKSTTRRTFEQYKTYGKEILRRPVQLIVMGDEKTISFAFDERRKHNLLEKTFFFHIPFETLPTYEYRERLEGMIPETGVNGYMNDKRFTPFYLICIWSKIYFLKKAFELNPFESTTFCWLDFGYYHLREEFSYVNHPDHYFTEIQECPKIRMVAMNGYSKLYVQNALDYYKRDNYLITGQIFSVPGLLIDEFYSIFMKELEYSISIRLPTPEENLFGRIIYLYPNLFALSAGYYATSFSNFEYCREFAEKSISVGREYIHHGVHPHGYYILDNVYRGYSKNSGLLSENQVYEILYNLVIGSYYVSRSLYDMYVERAKEFLKASSIKPSDLFLQNLNY
jgi:hypothetical protein